MPCTGDLGNKEAMILMVVMVMVMMMTIVMAVTMAMRCLQQDSKYEPLEIFETSPEQEREKGSQYFFLWKTTWEQTGRTVLWLGFV